MNKDGIRFILLSYPLNSQTPLYGDTPPIEIFPDKRINIGDSCNTSFIKFHNHSGTHIDAPHHFWDVGKSIADYSLDDLVFSNIVLVDCPKNPKEMIVPTDLSKFEAEILKADIILFRTGFWKRREEKTYQLENPGISVEAAQLIRKKYPNIRCVGLDTISVSSYSNRDIGRITHRTLLQKGEFEGDPIFLIEDLNLSSPELGSLEKLIVAPLFIEGIDSAPCTVIGLL